MKNRPHLFLLEEANALLPELEKRLSSLLEKKENYARRHDELFMHELIVRAEQHGGLFPLPDDELEERMHLLEKSITGLEKDIHEIHDLGCILRSLEKGWVDFLGRLEGELIYFCWQRGEKSIQFYHHLQKDITERLPLTP